MNILNRFTRRLFFRQAAAASLPIAGVQAKAAVQHQPKRCWTIMGANWENNDEYSYSAGEYATGTLFHNEEAAQAACQKLNDEFYAREDPNEFDAEFREEVTWEVLRDEDRFRDPFFVQELLQQDESRDHSC